MKKAIISPAIVRTSTPKSGGANKKLMELLSEREAALSADLAYDWIEVLELLGVTRDKLRQFNNVKELLAWRFHDSDEVDKFVKALYLLVPLFREAAIISTAGASLEKLH